MADYTRLEKYLDGILNNIPVPEPYTRIEMLLAAIAAKIGSGGGGGGDATADLTLVAVASGITTSGSYNTQAITGFTAFTLTANKGFDTLLAKARTKKLSIDGGVSWTTDGVATIADVNVHEQSVYPKEALSQLGIVTNKDTILLTLSSIYKRGDQTDRELELYLRFQPAMRLIYEDTNGDMQIIDPLQGG